MRAYAHIAMLTMAYTVRCLLWLDYTLDGASLHTAGVFDSYTHRRDNDAI